MPFAFKELSKTDKIHFHILFNVTPLVDRRCMDALLQMCKRLYILELAFGLEAIKGGVNYNVLAIFRIVYSW